MKNERPITIVHDDEDVSINIPLDILAYSQFHRPDGYSFVVKDKFSLAKFIMNNLLNFTSEVGRKETGMSDFFTLLDDVILDAYENGEDFIYIAESEK